METAESLGDDTNGADTALRGSVQDGVCAGHAARPEAMKPTIHRDSF